MEAAYEATLCAAVVNAQRGASNRVLLTSLGGGAFGNPDIWILDAIRRALKMASALDLDVLLVSYGTPPQAMIQIARDFEGDRRLRRPAEPLRALRWSPHAASAANPSG